MRRQISMKDFSADHADRLRTLRYKVFGTERPGKPRWLPYFMHTCFIPFVDRGRRSLSMTLDGRDSSVTMSLLKKLEEYGLVDRVALENVPGGHGLLLNAFAVEFLLKGRVDRTVAVPAKIMGYFNRIVATKDFKSEGVNLHARNSVIGLTQLDGNRDAQSIGINMTPAGFMAMVYDSDGLRITDIFARYRDADDYSWQYDFLSNSQHQRSITREDMKPALMLARLFGLSEDAIFLDKDLVKDISSRGFIFEGRMLRIQEPVGPVPQQTPPRSPRF